MAERIGHKHTPFGQRSRRRRNAAYIAVKNRIRRAAPILGGKFFTDDYMHGTNHWLDAYFLGPKAPLVYNLTIETTACAYREAVEQRVRDRSYELALDRQREISDRAIRDLKTRVVTYLPHDPAHHPGLGGMNHDQWIESQRRRIADSGEIQVHEGWTLHRDYALGIGVHATIDVPVLTIEAVNAFIDRFLANPVDFRASTSRSFRYEQIEHWGPDANLVIEPWDWPVADAGSSSGSTTGA